MQLWLSLLDLPDDLRRVIDDTDDIDWILYAPLGDYEESDIPWIDTEDVKRYEVKADVGGFEDLAVGLLLVSHHA